MVKMIRIRKATARLAVAVSTLCAAADTAAVWAAPCRFDDSLWLPLTQPQRDSALSSVNLSPLNEQCLVALLERARAEAAGPGARVDILQLFYTYAHGRQSFSRELLLAGLRLAAPHAGSPQWRNVLTAWERCNGPVAQAAGALAEAGRIREADSLYLAFSLGAMDPFVRIQWADVKAVLGNIGEAARLLCVDPKAASYVTPVARGRLTHLLLSADTPGVREALRTYRTCYAALPGIDTLDLRAWLAATYERFGLYADEVQTLLDLQTASSPAVRPLMELARRLFSARLFRQAILAARPALAGSTDPAAAAFCATVVYQSYLQLNKRDSALVWIGKAAMTGPAAGAEAAALFQDAGMFDKTDSVARVMAQSPARDTLRIRRFIVSGRPDSAKALASALAARGGAGLQTGDIAVWRARAALFGADMALFKNTLDSLRFVPSWSYAPEMLGYRYTFERIKSDPLALSDWPAVELALYRDRPLDAAKHLRPDGYSPAAARVLMSRVVKALLAHGNSSEAAALLSGPDPSNASAEHLYYCAEALLGQGQARQARQILERLMLAHPQDIFSSRARMLLMRIGSS